MSYANYYNQPPRVRDRRDYHFDDRHKDRVDKTEESREEELNRLRQQLSLDLGNLALTLPEDPQINTEN